jgi:hypothetical protein
VLRARRVADNGPATRGEARVTEEWQTSARWVHMDHDSSRIISENYAACGKCSNSLGPGVQGQAPFDVHLNLPGPCSAPHVARLRPAWRIATTDPVDPASASSRSSRANKLSRLMICLKKASFGDFCNVCNVTSF